MFKQTASKVTANEDVTELLSPQNAVPSYRFRASEGVRRLLSERLNDCLLSCVNGSYAVFAEMAMYECQLEPFLHHVDKLIFQIGPIQLTETHSKIPRKNLNSSLLLTFIALIKSV